MRRTQAVVQKAKAEGQTAVRREFYYGFSFDTFYTCQHYDCAYHKEQGHADGKDIGFSDKPVPFPQPDTQQGNKNYQIRYIHYQEKLGIAVVYQHERH